MLRGIQNIWCLVDSMISVMNDLAMALLIGLKATVHIGQNVQAFEADSLLVGVREGIRRLVLELRIPGDMIEARRISGNSGDRVVSLGVDRRRDNDSLRTNCLARKHIRAVAETICF